MAYTRITRMTCDMKGCSRYRDLYEPACGRARDKLKAIGWSHEVVKGGVIDFCSVCTAEIARKKAEEKESKEAEEAKSAS